jgi:1,2-diacylglycerol 3-alpha-glucosyltransferase
MLSLHNRSDDGKNHRPRVVLMWINFGPYHFARARALSDAFDLYAIEYASTQVMYGWNEPPPPDLRFESIMNSTYESVSRVASIRKLWRRLNEIRPDALLIPGYSEPAALAASLWGRLHRVKNILMSESNAHDATRRLRTEFCKQLAVKSLYDGAVVGGRRAADYIRSLGMTTSCIRYGYDVIDTQYFQTEVDRIRRSAQPGEFGLPHSYFLFVGRLAPEKNVASLLGSFESYRRSGGNRSLVIVGSGPLSAELRSLTVSNGCSEHVFFAGHKDYRQILPYYAFAEWFILPSVREPWGLVVNEAMASGLPVIVSNVCGCCDDLVRHGENGFVFDPNSGPELTQLLLEVSGMSQERRDQMSANSRLIISDFSLERWACSVSELLSSGFAKLPLNLRQGRQHA